MNSKYQCKYCIYEYHFIPDSEKDNFDGDEKGNYHSLRAIWTKNEMGVCEKFEDTETQWKRKQGFYYCDEKRAKECCFYEEKNNNIAICNKKDFKGCNVCNEKKEEEEKP